jgi:hypothetical protein
MGKRGPKPRGEYSGKTAVLSVRLQPDTRARLEAEKEASGRSFTQELEKHLRRSFVEDDRAVEFYGTVQNAAILKLIGLVIQAASKTRLRQARGGKWVPDPAGSEEWLRDPELFDSVCTAIRHTLAWFRPGGAIGGLSYSSDAEALLDEIRAADPARPLDPYSSREHALAKLKDGLGELAQRPHPYDVWSKAEPVLRSGKAEALIPAAKPAKRKRRKK